jgi:uncharacterized membrane protein
MAGWTLVVLTAFGMALYGLGHVLLGEQAYVDLTADSFRERPWGIFFHALFGVPAIALGPLQFLWSSPTRRRALHRALGKVYVIAALGTGAVGLYMSFYSYGGWMSRFGFTGMALAALITTGVAYVKIRGRNLAAHRAWMVRSYAVIFSAVTFRLWLPTMIVLYGGDVSPAYGWASWLSWVLNLAVVELYLQRSGLRRRNEQEFAA